MKIKLYLFYYRHRLGLSEIYMINLKRRPERRRKMEALFEILGLNVEVYTAIDGT